MTFAGAEVLITRLLGICMSRQRTNREHRDCCDPLTFFFDGKRAIDEDGVSLSCFTMKMLSVCVTLIKNHEDYESGTWLLTRKRCILQRLCGATDGGQTESLVFGTLGRRRR